MRCCIVTSLLQLLEGARGVRQGADATWGQAGAQTPRGVMWGAVAVFGWRGGGVQARKRGVDVGVQKYASYECPVLALP
jgi:hypothetical protein